MCPQRPSAGNGRTCVTVVHVGQITKRSSPQEYEGQPPGGPPATGFWATAPRKISDFPQHCQVSAGVHGQTLLLLCSPLSPPSPWIFCFRFGRILEDLDSLAGLHYRYRWFVTIKQEFSHMNTHFFFPQFSSLTLTHLTLHWRGLLCPLSLPWWTK